MNHSIFIKPLIAILFSMASVNLGSTDFARVEDAAPKEWGRPDVVVVKESDGVECATWFKGRHHTYYRYRSEKPNRICIYIEKLQKSWCVKRSHVKSERWKEKCSRFTDLI